MRLLPILGLLTTTALAAVCCSNSAGADDPVPNGRTFVSVRVDGDQIPGGGPLVVGFDNGRISAYAGCNRGSGPADLPDGVLVTRLAITMMACPPPAGDADGWMVDFLEGRPRWTLTGDTLTLTGGAGTVTMRDKQGVTPDRSLTGTTWLVRSLISPQAVTTSLALEQAHPTLSIAADGTVTGWTGCNRITGRADLADAPDAVEFGPLAVTRMACPDGLGEVEQAVLRALNGRVRTTIDADELQLKRDDGYGLALGAQ